MNLKQAFHLISILLLIGCGQNNKNTTCQTDQIEVQSTLADSVWIESAGPHQQLELLYRQCNDSQGVYRSWLYTLRCELKVNRKQAIQNLSKNTTKLEEAYNNLEPDNKALYFLIKAEYSFYLENDLNSALSNINLAMTHQPSALLRTELLSIKAFSYYQLGHFDSAEYYYQTLLAIPSTNFKLHFTPSYIKMDALNRVAIIKQYAGEYDSAVWYFKLCKAIQDSVIKNEYPNFLVEGSIANVLMTLGDTTEAVKYFQMAYNNVKDLKLINQTVLAYAGLYTAYQKTNMQDSIVVLRKDYNRYKNYCERTGFKFGLMALFVLKSDDIVKTDNLLALNYLDSAIQLINKQRMAFIYYDLILKKGEILVGLKRYDQNTIELLEDVYDFYDEIQKYKENLNLSSKLLYECYLAKNQKDKAYFYLEKHTELLKSIALSNRITNTNRLVRQYQLKEKESENNILKLEKEKSIARQKQRNILFSLGGIILIFIAIISYLTMKNRKKRYQQEIALKDSRIKLQSAKMETELEKLQGTLTNKFAEQQESFKQELASAFHDNIGSLLSTLKLNFSKIGDKVESLGGDLKKDTEKVENLLNQLMEEVSATSRKMSSGFLESIGLLAAVEELSLNVSESGLIASSFHSNLKEVVLPVKSQIDLFRIIQESVSNAIRHANPSSIDLSVLQQEDQLLVKVEDDGKGFNLDNKSAGIGLSNIKKRAQQIGGELEVSTKEGMGTSIMLQIDLNNHA